MDRKIEGELLTRVGPGTPMGNVMRQYWIPAIMSRELIADGDPVRVRLLGEDLIAFRVTSGAVGITDHRCPHRCASLFYGRNEEEGIRCVYHGWKFAADGQCVDQPNVGTASSAKRTVRAKAYPAIERCGVVWCYMGPREVPPPLPSFPIFDLPEDDVAVWCAQRECNFLQAIEGEIDTSHAGFLHLGLVDADGLTAIGQSPLDVTSAVRYKTAETAYGMLAGGYRADGEANVYWRFANFLFPFWTQIPPVPLGGVAMARAWVPMDDTHTMLFHISLDSFMLVGDRGRTPRPARKGSVGISFDYAFLPNTTDWYGRWRLAANQRNDFLIDRQVQRTSSYSGIEGLEIQDAAICESMGPITDHSYEHLVASDAAVVQTRRSLLKAALALQDDGITPPGVDDAAAYQQWSGFITAPKDADWRDVYSKNIPKQ